MAPLVLFFRWSDNPCPWSASYGDRGSVGVNGSGPEAVQLIGICGTRKQGRWEKAYWQPMEPQVWPAEQQLQSPLPMNEKQQQVLPLQLLPHAPQLALSTVAKPRGISSMTRVTLQPLEQHSSVAVHMPGNNPPEQSNSPRQTWPEVPQVQLPPAQPLPVPQLLPHSPQLVMSVVRFAQ